MPWITIDGGWKWVDTPYISEKSGEETLAQLDKSIANRYWGARGVC